VEEIRLGVVSNLRQRTVAVNDTDDEPTTEALTPTDAELLAEWRIANDLARGIEMINQPREGSDDDGN